MRTKNAERITPAESRHIARVKLLPCGVCGKSASEYEPSEAHHVEQGLHYAVIPLCADCHRGSHNGLHGQARIWSVYKATELSVLNNTIAALMRPG